MNTAKKQLTSTKPTSRVDKPKYDNIQNSAAYVLRMITKLEARPTWGTYAQLKFYVLLTSLRGEAKLEASS